MARGTSVADEPVRLLARVGSPDIAAMTGYLRRAAERGMPVVLDGIVSCSAALVAERLAPGCRAWWIAGHRSTEPASRAALESLGLPPLLDLGPRLGEGTGALLAIPLLNAAAATLRRDGDLRQRRRLGPRAGDATSRAPMPDAVRLAIGTLTRIPVPAPRTVDRRVAGRAMLLAPLVGAAPRPRRRRARPGARQPDSGRRTPRRGARRGRAGMAHPSTSPRRARRHRRRPGQRPTGGGCPRHRPPVGHRAVRRGRDPARGPPAGGRSRGPAGSRSRRRQPRRRRRHRPPRPDPRLPARHPRGATGRPRSAGRRQRVARRRARRGACLAGARGRRRSGGSTASAPGWPPGVPSSAACSASAVVVRIARRRLGGITGDVLGATAEITTAAVLVILVAVP